MATRCDQSRNEALRPLRSRSGATPMPRMAGLRDDCCVRYPNERRTQCPWTTTWTADVSDELFWDPKVDSAAIAVSADGGTITLRGTVGSLREKREAKKAAQRVFGVISVDNQLQVRLMIGQRRARRRSSRRRAPGADARQPRPEDGRREGRGRLRHPHRHRRLAVPARRGRLRRLEHRRRARRLRRDRAEVPDARAPATCRTRSRRRSSGTPRSTRTTCTSRPTTAR